MNPSDKTAIRRLTVDDVAAFRELREEAIKLQPESFGSPEEEQGGEQQMSAYRRWLDGDIWGAFDQDRLIGTTGFFIPKEQKTPKTYGQVFTVYVREAYRGKGIGDLLLKHIISIAKGHVDQVHLFVVHTAEAAIKTYLKNGFEICNIDRGSLCLGDKTYDELLMVKILG